MMTTDDMACNELINIDVDTLAPHDLKQEKLKLSATLRKYYSFCKRRTFGTFVASKRASTTVWNCCGQTFKELSSIHKHVARTHDTDIHQLTQSTFEVLLSQFEKEATSQQQSTNNQSQWTFPPGYLTPVTGDQLHNNGGAECFCDLRVGVYKEIVPMGVDPDALSYSLAGTQLEPEEFHKEVLSKGDSCNDTILLDCQNFYESRIGQFRQCLAPNIRKFSYFPDYVDQNLDLFRDKKVLMYCTGGIRCERGSAYLRSKHVCKEVYQLKGGIHKYLEQFPEGFYRGKLFMFDERFAISSNSDIILECRYCNSPWDQYQLCSTHFCCQLVLSCSACRQGGHTACCPICQGKGKGEEPSATPPQREEC